MCSRGPLPLCGPLPLAGGGKMPLPHKWHTSIKQYGNNFYQNRQG